MTREQKLGLYAAAAIVVAFLIGFLWQNTRARKFEAQLERANYELTFETLEARLAAAIIEADRGNYENARQMASEFFTHLQVNMKRAPQEQQQALHAIAGHRDGVITAASRADPQTSTLLTQLYSTYRVAFGEQPVSMPVPPVRPPTTTTTQ